jgi:hypothetical protein
LNGGRFDAKGKQKWKQALGSPVCTALVAAAGLVAAVSSDGKLILLDASSGAIRASSEGILVGGSSPLWTGKHWVGLGREGEVVCFRAP